MHFPPTPIIFFLEAHGAEGGDFWTQVVHSNVINIAIAFVFLVWVFKRFNLLDILEQRQNKVMLELKEAEEKRDKALAELNQIEKRTAGLTEEVSHILKDAEETAGMVATGIIRSAEAEADKLLENAQKRAALEEKSAVRELEHRLMLEAIHGAKELLENTLSDADKQQSVEDFVSVLPDLIRKGI